MRKTIFILFSCFISFAAGAFSISPMVAEMTPTAPQNQLRLQVRNTGSTPLPVQANPLLLNFDNNGSEALTDTDDLMVLPVTTTIAPNSVQTFLVRYIGSPRMQTSKSYRIAFEAANIAPEANISGVQLQYRFLTLINVKLPSMQAEVIQNRTFQQNGKWYLELTNKGNGYARFIDMQWQVGVGDKLSNITTNQVQEHIKGGMLLPKKTQRYEFTPFKGIPPQSMKVSIKN